MLQHLLIEYVIPASIWIFFGLRFAYKFLTDTIHSFSSIMDIVDASVGAVFALVFWPFLVIAKLIKDS